MRRIAPLILALCNLYAAAVVVWQALRLAFGDRWWWLALANTLSLQLFLPLVALWPLALISRRRAALATLALPTIGFLMLYGGLLIPRGLTGKAADVPPLRVMSYNVLCLNEDAAAVERVIRAVSPDVVCIQELTPHLTGELTVRLGGDYPYRFLLPEPDTSGMGVFSRLPLRNPEVIPDPYWEPGSQAAEIDYRGQALLVINAHAVPSLIPFTLGSNNLNPFERYYRLREQESRLWLARAAAHDGPVVLAGDLNASDQNVSVRMLAGQFQDAHRRSGSGLGLTWPAYGGSLGGLPYPARMWRVDYVLASDEWQVISSHVGPWDGQSDHRPVWADLSLKPGRQD